MNTYIELSKSFTSTDTKANPQVDRPPAFQTSNGQIRASRAPSIDEDDDDDDNKKTKEVTNSEIGELVEFIYGYNYRYHIFPFYF